MWTVEHGTDEPIGKAGIETERAKVWTPSGEKRALTSREAGNDMYT